MSRPDPAPPEPAADVRAPGPGDTVPLLREDLLIGRGEAPGAYQVRPPEGGAGLVLLDFEVTVARMLDGRRSVAEVMRAADQLGIPVDEDGLGKFLRTLERHLLLAPAGSRAAGGGGRPPRKVWDAATRERFRAAMRLVRTGQPEAATPILRDLLARDPGLPEVSEQLALIEAGHALAARPIGEVFSERQAAAPRRGSAGRLALGAVALALVVAGVWGWRWLERDRAAQRSEAAQARQAAEAASREAQDAARQAERAAQAAGRLPGGGQGGSSPSASPGRTAPVEARWHPALAELRAPAAGVVAWRQPVPTRVARGERLGEVRAARGPAAPGPEARARLLELEELARRDPVYQEFLEKERAVLTGEAGEGRSFGLVAPAAGDLTLVTRSEGRAGQGDVVGRVVDPDAWRISATVSGAPPAVGAALELAGDGVADRASARVVEVRPGAGRAEVILAIPATEAPWLEGARAPYLRLP